MPAVAFAAAGFADAFHAHRRWIFPAYAYCLVFGITILLGMLFASFIWKSKMRTLTEKISRYLINHREIAIIFMGILQAIPIGIILDVSYEFMWIMAVGPTMELMIALPIILLNRQIREKWLLSSLWIQVSLMIAISSIAASLVFVVLTNYDMLPGTDNLYFHRGYRGPEELHYSAHPYDSMIEVWTMPIFVMAEIPFILMLHWIGGGIRYLRNKSSEFRNSKRATYHGRCIED